MYKNHAPFASKVLWDNNKIVTGTQARERSSVEENRAFEIRDSVSSSSKQIIITGENDIQLVDSDFIFFNSLGGFAQLDFSLYSTVDIPTITPSQINNYNLRDTTLFTELNANGFAQGITTEALAIGEIVIPSSSFGIDGKDSAIVNLGGKYILKRNTTYVIEAVNPSNLTLNYRLVFDKKIL